MKKINIIILCMLIFVFCYSLSCSAYVNSKTTSSSSSESNQSKSTGSTQISQQQSQQMAENQAIAVGVEPKNVDSKYVDSLKNGTPYIGGVGASGGNSNAIARELYELDICAYDHRVDYNEDSVSGKWKLEFDCSVANRYGPEGGELVSPVLRDTPETWRNLEKICEVARKQGAMINQKCGGHVHMGMDPLDTARQRWKRFFRTIGGFEDVIYRVAN